MAEKGKVDALDYAGELTEYIKVHKEFDALKIKEKEIIARINKDHIKAVDFTKKENSIIEVEGKSYALSAVMDRNSKKTGSEKVFKYTIHAANIIKKEEDTVKKQTVTEPTAAEKKKAEKEAKKKK